MTRRQRSERFWATIKSVNPLRVQLRGDSKELSLVPGTFVDKSLLAVGNMVRVEIGQDGVFIVAKLWQ